jgi:hypothetical protein
LRAEQNLAAPDASKSRLGAVNCQKRVLIICFNILNILFARASIGGKARAN